MYKGFTLMELSAQPDVTYLNRLLERHHDRQIRRVNTF